MQSGRKQKMAGSHVEIFINISNQKSNVLQLKCTDQERERIQEEEKIFPSTGGGFQYENQSKLTKNRQIIWRVLENVIELEEFSLDYNLFSNKLSINVAQGILLPNVVIHECEKEVYIFFATTRSVHQVVLQHPNFNEYGYIIPSGINVSIPSIFHHADSKSTHSYSSLTLPCHSYDVTVTRNDVYFGLVTSDKTLLVVSLSADDEEKCVELKDAGLMQRLWTGLVPSFVRGDTAWMGVESVIIHCFNDEEVYAFTLCRDLKIRVWKINTKTCVLAKDLVSLIPDKLDSQEGIGSLTLKKAISNSSKQLTLAAHCCLAYSSQFIILETFQEPNNVVIMHVSNFFSDFNSVQDVLITSQYVWALWSSSEGEHSVSYAPIEGGKDFERGWHTAHVKQTSKDVYVPVYQDAKEVYIEKIFSPCTFHKESVIKALQVYAKTNDIGRELIPDTNADIDTVKRTAIQILDLEMERTLLSMDVQSVDYQHLQNQYWAKFHSFVQQFEQLRQKPLGIFTNSTSTTTLIIRQETCGYLYFHDWIDHLWISALDSCDRITSYIDDELELKGDNISHDVLSILECAKTIPKQFHLEVIQGIDKDLDGNEDVETFLASMASVLVTNSSEFEQLVGDPVERGDYLCQIEGRLKNIRNPQRACDIILSSLESVDFTSTSNLDQSDVASPNSIQFLCSAEGVQFTSNLIQTTAYNRMHLCRDLFVLMTLIEKMCCKIGINGPDMKDFNVLSRSICYELMRSYHCIYWSSTQTFLRIDASLVDSNISNLAALNLTEKSPSSKSARKIASEDPNFLYSYLYCYLRDYGLQSSLNYLTESNLNEMKPGDYSSMEMMKLISKVSLNELSILNDKSSDFPEYLASHGQYTALNNYIHLSDNWCTINRGTKDFLLAQSYLGNGQPEKAFKFFISGARGISQNEPLILKLVEKDYEENLDNPDDDKQELLVQYFIKVTRIFEQFEYPTYVITTATSAIAIATKENKNVPMLWSVIFKYNLELEHYNDAYAAIVHNTDKSRRFDCLRHFVVTLCEHEMFHEICSYPYVGLEEEVVNIIETRARTMDITVNKYYDLLYSYHILKNDYRKASTTMYEQACRLSTEMHGLKSLQKQAKCYLASMTTLSLVDEKYAWIVRPQEKFQRNTTYVEKNTAVDYSHSPKRKEDGEEVYYSVNKKRKSTKTVVLEMNDLEKEYLLILARLKLIQHGKNDTAALGPGLTSQETVGLLSHIGLYDMAFTITSKFNLPLKNVFESLAGKCASLTNRNISDFDEEWKWLTLNEISASQLVTAKSALDQAFHFLQIYLKQYDNGKNSSVLLKTVASKFLSMGCLLPAWLVIDYQRLNASELLHLYLSYDMVDAAYELSIKYIEGVLGKGKEYFGLNTALHATTPAVWLPYTYFDHLLKLLKENYDSSNEASTMYDVLQTKLDDYFTQLEVISCDKLDYMRKMDPRVA